MENESFPSSAASSLENPTEKSEPAAERAAAPTESFAELLSEFEHEHKKQGGAQQLEGTVVSVSADSVFLDIGFKVEGVLPRTAFENNADEVKAGDRFPVSVKGRNEEHYYVLSRFKVAQPTDWASLEAAHTQRTAIVGTVTAVVKGGLSVDVGVRAFMPASRSGAREAKEMEELVGQQIECRIIKLDTTEEDVVVDRRVVLEEQAAVDMQGRWSALAAGEVMSGKVRSLTGYGAFVDLGGIDGLLHISDISWSRVEKAEDVLTVGQEIQVKVLKVDPETRRISLGMKQLGPEPWDAARDKYKVGERVTATVRKLMDFGAFVELEPGIEGLIHVSEMSWVKKVRKPSDVLKEGDTVEAVILSVNPAERRIALGLKQTLGDPWRDAAQKFPVGAAVEGPVTQLMKFGAFVQVAEGVEGLVHVSEISAEKHIHHPQDVLKTGQVVRAQVLGVDTEKRQMKLSMKQLVPTSIDEYLAEHRVGDVVSGRVVGETQVELGEGIRAAIVAAAGSPVEEKKGVQKADLSSLTSMLQARWKAGATAAATKAEPLRAGQVRSFRIVKIDGETKAIEVELA
jgi:small subunit ribosomal protein S1